MRSLRNPNRIPTHPGAVLREDVLPELAYPFHDRTIVITECGRICMDRKKIMLSSVLAGQRVGVMQVEDQIWQVSFMDYDLGYFDMDSCRLEPGPNPFGPRVLTM